MLRLIHRGVRPLAVAAAPGSVRVGGVRGWTAILAPKMQPMSTAAKDPVTMEVRVSVSVCVCAYSSVLCRFRWCLDEFFTAIRWSRSLRAESCGACGGGHLWASSRSRTLCLLLLCVAVHRFRRVSHD